MAKYGRNSDLELAKTMFKATFWISLIFQVLFLLISVPGFNRGRLIQSYVDTALLSGELAPVLDVAKESVISEIYEFSYQNVFTTHGTDQKNVPLLQYDKVVESYYEFVSEDSERELHLLFWLESSSQKPYYMEIPLEFQSSPENSFAAYKVVDKILDSESVRYVNVWSRDLSLFVTFFYHFLLILPAFVIAFIYTLVRAYRNMKK